MITVKVHTILTLKKIIGRGETEISLPEESDLKALLSHIVDIWGDRLSSQIYEPGTETILPHIRLMINGRDVAFLNGMETILHDGDELLMLPPASGG